ncbi:MULTISPECIES: DUF5753 domain-containing protein [Micromonospora]|uniref:DUF5753 domain-containing protein n=1 Tax=Micromonospora yangpuensis TaxID=683228 RepID=A0A1C6UH33_9ACTN|nr:DUF5753 domain-containing protein [Micromonospora yangpuensis]GGM04385.1 hypothetical protein GCM10012279_22700 [Micromonospora yangpuensis]SCL53281.1 hypothetical protein GA0070617_2323 [Micromonospora yangpuensis]
MNHVLIEAMTQCGETADSLAAQVGVDPKSVQRWVNPGAVPHPRHRSTAARVLGRDVGDLWPSTVRRREPAWFRRWADIERAAVSLRTFQLAWVPGLLQTEAYARATLAGEALSVAEVDGLVEGRTARQSILRRDRPPLLVAVIDETVLRRTLGGDRAMMREQCAYLLACAELPSVRVHVVPSTVGIYSGHGGPITLAELGDGSAWAHVDSQGRGEIVDSATDLATLSRRWELIRGVAMSVDQSRDLLEEVAASWT